MFLSFFSSGRRSEVSACLNAWQAKIRTLINERFKRYIIWSHTVAKVLHVPEVPRQNLYVSPYFTSLILQWSVDVTSRTSYYLVFGPMHSNSCMSGGHVSLFYPISRPYLSN
jgi:hypothetical protein